MRNFKCRISLIALAIASCAMMGNAQIDLLEGQWILATDVDGSEFGTFAIDAAGNVSCDETIAHEFDGSVKYFDITQIGKSQLTGSIFTYFGGGTASDREASTSSYRVTNETIASGVVSPASTTIVGVWSETQIYTQLIKTVDTYKAPVVPFILTHEDYVAPTAGYLIQEIEGQWDIEMESNSLSLTWDGEVKLNTNGTIVGMLRDSMLTDPDRPTAGIFTLNEDGSFYFEFVKVVNTENIDVELNINTIVISGSGQLSEDNTQINGTWTIAVGGEDDLNGETNSTAAKTMSVSTEATQAEGEFTMTKSDESDDVYEIASSTFSDSRENWRIIGEAQDGSVIPMHNTVGGNPGGFVEAVDDVVGGTWYWQAPAKFLGDRSAAYEGVLAFDLKQEIDSLTASLYDDDDIVLTGGAGDLSLVYRSNQPPSSFWTHYEVTLKETDWVVEDRFREPTALEMQAVLGSLRELRIRGEYNEGADQGGLDNVFLFGRFETETLVSDWMMH